jgi:hypothetical protein
MSDQLVKIDLDGERMVGLRFEEFPDDLHDALLGEINAISNELFARVQAATPSKTGELRSQERLRIFDQEERIRGYISIAGGSNSGAYAKAGALEYGSKGKPVDVRSHTKRLDHFWENRLRAPINVLVEAYSRTPNIAERNFMRGPLDAMAPEILSRLNRVITQTTEQADQS